MSISQIEIDSWDLNKSIDADYEHIHDLMVQHSEITESVQRSEYESFAKLLEKKRKEYMSFKSEFILKQQTIQHNFDQTLKSYDKILLTLDTFIIQNNNARISTLQKLSLAVIDKNNIQSSDPITDEVLRIARVNAQHRNGVGKTKKSYKK